MHSPENATTAQVYYKHPIATVSNVCVYTQDYTVSVSMATIPKGVCKATEMNLNKKELPVRPCMATMSAKETPIVSVYTCLKVRARSFIVK